MNEARIARLRAALARAKARRQKVDERACNATAALSDAEEAETRARARLTAALVQAGLVAALRDSKISQGGEHGTDRTV